MNFSLVPLAIPTQLSALHMVGGQKVFVELKLSICCEFNCFKTKKKKKFEESVWLGGKNPITLV